MDNSTVKQRLIRYIKSHGMTQKSFQEALGVSPGYINSIRKSIGADVLARLTELFPDLSRDWLLYGEGEMLKASEPKGVPVYDTTSTGGATGLVSSSNQVANLIGYINSGDWFDRKETAIIRHVGDSMTEYPDGCWLAVKRVLNPKLLVPGQNYVIETEEFRVTKRVQRGSEPGYLKIYSTNRERYDDGQLIHEPFEVHLSDVRRMFSVLGYVVNQSGEIKLMSD